jgi:HEAT repeat protein
MGKYDKAIAKTGLALEGHAPVAHALSCSYDSDPKVRRVAAKALCPCHVQANVPEVWERLIEMTSDDDVGVRLDVVHALADGSPRERAHDIAEVLERMYNDPDAKVRKRVRRVVSAYRRTENLNVL